MGVNVEMLKTCVVCGSEKRISDPCLGLQLPLPVESMRLVRVIRDRNMFERTHTHMTFEHRYLSFSFLGKAKTKHS